MINYYLDIALCGITLFAEIFGAIVLALAVQLIFYRVFKINLYKTMLKKLDSLDKRLTEIFG